MRSGEKLKERKDRTLMKARALWGCWMVFTLFFWFWSDNYLGSLLPLLSVLVPVLLCILTHIGEKRLSVSLSASVTGMKGEFSKGRVLLKNSGFFPQGRVICILKGENLLTGEQFQMRLGMSVPAHGISEQEIEFTSRHCGKLRLTLSALDVYDPFGLFCRALPESEETVILYQPDTFQIDTEIMYGESLSLDSDMFSMTKPGSDSSEVFAIREYRPGDRIRQIHWKLSEKLDTIMVKEYGLPIQNTILLVLETGVIPGEAWLDPACMDAAAESLFSLSASLLEKQTVHSIACYDHEAGQLCCREVNDEGELIALSPQILSAVPGEDDTSVLAHYLGEHEQFEFAHVVVFTPYHMADLASFEGGSLITEVVCEPQSAGTYQENGVRVISVTPESKEQELVYLEI